MKEKEKERIYIVLTQTGTILSRIIKKYTGAEYNHASIATDENLNNMYSFGRLNAYWPFTGGYVKESLYRGTFKRFKETDALIIGLDVTTKQYETVYSYLKFYEENKKRLHYNYMGLFMAAFGKKYISKHRYYCSEFVKAMLVKANIVDADCFSDVIHPIHFFELFEDKVVYKGKLKFFPVQDCFESVTPFIV